MKFFSFLILPSILFLINIIQFVSTNDETHQDSDEIELVQESESEWEPDHEVEERFIKLHHDYKKVRETPWPQIENLTAELLKDICSQVLFDIYRSHLTVERFSYKNPTTQGLHKRVIKNAPVRFHDGVRRMTLLMCSYRTADFFLIKADDGTVFRLEPNTNTRPREYFFHDGPHPVNYSNRHHVIP